MPTIGAEARTEAAGNDIPSWCSRGMRKATPLARQVVAMAASRELARMTHRRVLVAVAGDGLVTRAPL
ncbi:hypothetical protein nbrc107697_24370 [Gordonia crocea]|uniref:Uncharacterized protein n=1 Tax=Gordonia crocea TaxID=589162 RepID=A0A7I9UYZ8_9ACTN|nr:hypothetical protein nbrc107697_24370 [Gordonia crocea]